MELGAADHVGDLASAALDRDVVLVLGVVELLIVVVPLGVGVDTFAREVFINPLGGVDSGINPELLQLGAAHHALVEGHVGEGGDTVL